MSDERIQSEPAGIAEPPAGQYVVVARRYRPQSFDELIGQEHVARALSNAISLGRVGHAYLFTGARGVGKTSAARILAKALDCQQGPTPNPCNACDICLSINAGSDVDVLEIDGASNRGIDEIRQLRQNVGVRASRARFKIYIIDEVHMLTREAFNALLKTLEEPPDHVKFIFCTTEASKIPITILSRCQRFDFAGIRSPSIAERLRQIVVAEGVEVEAAALELLARRAAGSMRDSQSLLEQLLAFGRDKITGADVHSLLGTAAEGRMASLTDAVVARDPAAALGELDAALAEGVDVGQLLEQLLGYLRDAMVVAVGGSADNLTTAPADRAEQLAAAAGRLGLETILAMLQIVEQTLSRLRYSTQGRILAELAIVRLCSLPRLDDLADLIARLQTGGGASAGPAARPVARAAVTAHVADPPAPSAVSPPHVTPVHPTEPSSILPLTAESAQQVWDGVLTKVSELLAGHAGRYASLAIPAPNRLAVGFPRKYNFHKSFCERPDQHAELERALAGLVGSAVSVDLVTVDDENAATVAEPPARPVVSQRRRLAEKSDHPLVRRASELFDAHPVRFEDPQP